MHRAGYAAFTGDALQPPHPPDDATAMPAGAWGYLGGPTALELGFHPPRRPDPRRPDAEAGYGGEAYDAARVDCDRQVAERIGSPPASGADLVSRLFDESTKAAARDSRVVEARRTWASCMEKAGFPASAPEDLPKTYGTGPEITQAELAAARADADCTDSSGLAGIWFAAVEGYQRQLIDHNSQALTAVKEAVRAQGEKLTELIAGEGKSQS
ncbi:hypothetical protein ACIBCA_05215 [Kitasatospora sp. NPDC051170]|uniref:hypothetical protein n=1 Tax=Kitasatospora sp. NPDC051170 TaxID=3364056 RepID=UPI003789A43E